MKTGTNVIEFERLSVIVADAWSRARALRQLESLRESSYTERKRYL